MRLHEVSGTGASLSTRRICGPANLQNSNVSGKGKATREVVYVRRSAGKLLPRHHRRERNLVRGAPLPVGWHRAKDRELT